MVRAMTAWAEGILGAPLAPDVVADIEVLLTTPGADGAAARERMDADDTDDTDGQRAALRADGLFPLMLDQFTDQFLLATLVHDPPGTQRIVKYDLKGNYLFGWGQPGGQPGQFWGPHQIAVDQEGNVYVAEVQNGRIQKFRPKANADRDKLIGQEVRMRAGSAN